MAEYLFTSNRLGFRKWSLANDVDDLLDINGDPEVMRFFPSTQDRSHTKGLIEEQIQGLEKVGYCFYAVDLLEENKLIGSIGLSDFSFPSISIEGVEIGWRLNKNYWRKGYATEGALKCLEIAKSAVNVDHIYSFTALINLPSQGVMKKIGMSVLTEFDHPKLEPRHPLCRHIMYRIENR